MVRVPLDSTDEELFEIVRPWLDVLATQDYERVFNEIGYALSYGAGAQGIRRDIESYRSSEYFPGETQFRVTDARTAHGGNPDQSVLIQRFDPSDELPLVVSISVYLPLNGRWSDLMVDFVVSKPTPDADHGVLWLEDIHSNSGDTEETDAYFYQL